MSTTARNDSTATSQNVTLPPIPELFDPNFLDVLVPQTDPTPMEGVQEVTPSAMMDALQSTAHQKLTANAAPAFSSTLVATLDAYVGLRTGISGEKVDQYLDNAWPEDPNLTLRIIWCTRSIHDGKGEKKLFHRAFGWLLDNHPRTAITNLRYLVDPVCQRSGKAADKDKKGQPGVSHGYWKDLLDILALATVDELRPRVSFGRSSKFSRNHVDSKTMSTFESADAHQEWPRTRRIEQSRLAHERLVQNLADKRYRALYVAVARLFGAQLANDASIMDKIDTLPANADRSDRMGLIRALTLASKWAPTPGGSHDRVTNIASAICLLLNEAQVSFPIFQKIASPVTASLPVSDMHLLRYHYQKHILTRGRRYLCIPEPLMSSNRWSDIQYTRVASICMNRNKEKFFIHDEDRFMHYLGDVGLGKKKISGATLLPHILAMEAVDLHRLGGHWVDSGKLGLAPGARERRLAEARMKVIEGQWATLVSRLRESGQLNNCIAVCDVSGSMGSLRWPMRGHSPFDVPPIWPAVSLSLLVARLAKPPFNDVFITFSASPEFVSVDPDPKRSTLGATIAGMGNTGWGTNTDFNAVFLKLILPLAIQHKVPKDQMIKRIFVFSDMQFDDANNQRYPGWDPMDWSTSGMPLEARIWKTNHDLIAKAYAEAGYDVPELVYWDLSNPRDGYGITAPVTGEREGVALLSGYSPALLKLFMGVEEEEEEEEEEWDVVDDKGESRPEKQTLTPEEVMKKALGRKSYQGLIVVD